MVGTYFTHCNQWGVIMKNLRECFESLYKEAGHQIEKFGSISIVNGMSERHDFKHCI